VRSAEEIIAGLLSSEAPEDPVGMALCLLTIDVQRVSGDAVDERILRHLLPRYLGSDVDDVVFRGGLAWAARPVLGTEGSLLRQTTRPDGAQVWEAHPAAIAADARTGRPVHEAVVQLLVDQLTALRLAVESDDPRLAAEAAVRLGDLLGKLGDQAGARWAYERAVDSGHEEHAPMAAYLLGLHLEIEGDHAGAYRAYRVAALAPATPFGPQAAMNLGNLAFRNGERRLAEEGWRLAAGGGVRPSRACSRRGFQSRRSATGGRGSRRRSPRLRAGGGVGPRAILLPRGVQARLSPGTARR
jgi:hypothetical protein